MYSVNTLFSKYNLHFILYSSLKTEFKHLGQLYNFISRKLKYIYLKCLNIDTEQISELFHVS